MGLGIHTLVTRARGAKRVAFFLILTINSGCIYTTPFREDGKTVVPVRESYISIQNNYILYQRFGSAVIVGNGLAVTNRHVVEGVPNMKASMSGGSVAIRNVMLSDRYDLAFIEIPCGVGTPIKTGGKVKEHEPVFSVGTSSSRTVIEGIVVASEFSFYLADLILPEAKFDAKTGKSYTGGFLYEGNVTHGYSGGPVVNRDGALVGINQGFMPEFALNKGVYDQQKRHGLAYHVEDVMSEMRHMSAHREYRCEN